MALIRRTSGALTRSVGEHYYGSKHSDDKTARLRDYLQAFTTALKRQSFTLVYIDACAGSGDRTEMLPALPLLDGNDATPQTLTVPGSARLAIEVSPPFDYLLLIERDPGRFSDLRRLAAKYPERSIDCHRGDANEVVQRFCCTAPWRGSRLAPNGMRGVIFLDPYGMQIDWQTVETIAATGSLDCWYFFPLMGLYRQAANAKPDIDDYKRTQLNRVLGTDDWERSWYSTPHGPTDLFGGQADAVRMADVNAIERYVKQRLESVFKGGVLDPLRIRNDRGLPIASLFFAVSNARAAELARRIARHILTRRSSPAIPRVV